MFVTLKSFILLEKLIPKLIVENTEKIYLSQNTKEQANFYENLYLSDKNTSHKHQLFFDKTNPFLAS